MIYGQIDALYTPDLDFVKLEIINNLLGINLERIHYFLS